MNIETIENELEELLAHSDYEVSFRHATHHSFFYTYVLHDGIRIAEKTFHPPFASYRRAARWAKKRIKDHERGLQELGPLVKR